jgi:hypothetical protein
MLNILFATTLSAFAQEPISSSWGTKGFETQETRIMLGVVGEFWAEQTIAEVYQPSDVFVNLSMRYRFHQHFSVGTEIGLVDISGNNNKSTLQLIPTVLHANVLFGDERIEPFAGLGLSIVHFLETYSSSTISGSKVGLDSSQTAPKLGYGTQTNGY